MCYLTVSNSNFPFLSNFINFIESPILEKIEKPILIVENKELYKKIPKNVNIWCLSCRMYELKEIDKMYEEVYFTEKEYTNKLDFGLELELEPLFKNFQKFTKTRIKILENFGIEKDKLFSSKIGLDGDLSVFEFRSDPYDNIGFAIEDILNSVKSFYNYIKNEDIILSFGLFNSCGLHINLGATKNWQYIKPLLDLSIYSYARKMNTFIRDYLGYSRSSYRRKSFGWEYRAFPATIILITDVLYFAEELIKRFVNGEKFILEISEEGIGWIINNKELLEKQKKIYDTINEIFFDVIINNKKIFEIDGVQIYLDLDEINEEEID